MSFYLPLALIGFNPISFVTINAFQTLYQFWIHTKTINKLPRWFEFVFNTPSHHRVHHGRNPKYIDKNHGGTLIIFDRMFGSFQAEEEPVIYGVTKPLSTWNPIWANLDWYVDMWQDLKKPMSMSERIRLVFSKPGWLPSHLGGYRTPQEITLEEAKVYDTEISKGLNYYILLQYVFILAVASFFLFNLDDFSRSHQVLIASIIVLSITNLGGLFESKTWAYWLEFIRWIGAIVFGFIFLSLSGTGFYVLLLLMAISLVWLRSLSGDFLEH